MNKKLISAGLLAATAAAIAFFPGLRDTFATNDPSAGVPPVRVIAPKAQTRVEVVFVLDTTGSMGGLIAAAKEKIWSIATTMASANEAPEVHMGIVAYRDRGDAYVTRRIELSPDLDSAYAALMELRAEGGGDGPESVNQALHEAVQSMSWSQDPGVYKVVFLVGDAPPHMDYVDDVPYPETLALAKQRGIVVNAIQAGRMGATERPWQQIAQLGGGEYFRVSAGGDAVALATPFDEKLAALSEKLDATRLYYGDAEQRAKKEKKQAAAARLHEQASVATRARRATFNASASGEANLIGEQELVDDIASGRVTMQAVPAAALSPAMASMPVSEREALVERKAEERATLTRQIRELAQRRDAFLAEKVDELGGATDSLDQKIYDAVRTQGARAGLRYESAVPRY